MNKGALATIVNLVPNRRLLPAVDSWNKERIYVKLVFLRWIEKIFCPSLRTVKTKRYGQT